MTRKMREGCCATYCRAPATRSVSRKPLGRALRLHWNAAVGVPPPRKRHSRLSLVHLQASKGRNKSRRVSSSAQDIAAAGEMGVLVLRPMMGASETGMSGEGWAFIRSQKSKVKSRRSKVNQLEIRAENCTRSSRRKSNSRIIQTAILAPKMVPLGDFQPEFESRAPVPSR